MLSIVIFLCSSFLSIILSQPTGSNFQKFDLPSTSVGPEAFTFDSLGRGPYTGISDGRIIKYNGTNFVDAYITSPIRRRFVCDGTNNPALGYICGRPLGMGFYLKKNLLYVADAYRGFLVVGPNETLARPIATGAEGVPFKFPDGLDVDQLTGDVYFTDASAVFQFSQIPAAVLANDATGRLLKYSSMTKQVKVLMRGLGGPAGVAISSNSSFVLVTEYIPKRIQKFWLSGPKAFTSEVILTLQGRPDNIKRTPEGDNFWVAVSIQSLGGLFTKPTAIKINENGDILQTWPLDKYYINTPISEFQPRGVDYYVGSNMASFAGLLN